MKKAFAVLVILFIAHNSISQNETISRLQRKLNVAHDDTSRIVVLDSLGLYYLFFTTKQDSALYYINQAVNYAFPLNDKRYLIMAYSRLSLCLFATAKYKTAMEIALKAIKLSDKYNIQSYYSPLYGTLSAINYQLEDNKQALRHAKVAAHYLEFAIDPFLDQQSYAINTLGWSYGLNGIYDSALPYLDKGLRIARTSTDQTAFDESCFFTGFIYYDLKNYKKADSILREGMEHSKKIHDHGWLENFPYALALIQVEQKKFDEAIATAHLAMDYADSIDDKKFMAKSAYTLYTCFEKKNKPDSALYYLKLSSQLNNEVASADINKEIQQLLFTEQLDEKEEQARRVLEKERIRNQVSLYVFITASAFFIIVLFLQWRNNKHKQKANAMLLQQKQKVESTLKELKTTQAQLIQSEKMASLGELTAGIAHEIQNPLNFVNNFSEVNGELIEELQGERRKAEGGRDEILEDEIINDIKQNLEKINHHGRRADAIVKGMLQHSKTSAGIKEPTDINKLADEYLRLSYHGMRAKDKEFNADIKTEFDDSIVKINVVRQDIGRVLLNLFNNAFYAVNEKRKTSVENYQPTIVLTTKRNGSPSGAGGIEIRISDNGNGIPQKILNKIFQPFFTTKPTGQGTGLGLSLAYDIIKAHGGEIIVETKEAEGSNFTIRLAIV